MALSLLLIDDDAIDREAVRRTVRAAGLDASITDAATAADAAAAVAAQSFDCILLDYQLPSTDGLAVLADFRAGGVDTPVVALTGHANRKTAVAIMKAGAADCLTKDALSPEGLERSIRHAMWVAASERERRELLAREQAALAEARAANRAKDELLAALSHEIRRPLNSILGWTHLLTSGTLDPAAAPRALAMPLDVAAAERPDVLLSDIAMPDGDGYSLVARFRALQAGVPAIAMTACVSPDNRLRATSAGFEPHVPKPVDPAALVSTILAIRPSTSSRPT